MQAQRDTKAINKPLTILGAEQKLFFTALIMDAAAFNLFGSLLVFGSLFLMAQWATRTNPQILRILPTQTNLAANMTRRSTAIQTCE